MKKRGQRSSDKLLEIMHSDALTEDICFEEILKLLGERAFGIALLFFSLPSALPFSVIPGVAQESRYLVKDFRTSKSQKSTRQRAKCLGRERPVYGTFALNEQSVRLHQ
ncbi:hypothetical protein E3983_04930 [Legionella israelensis]|uniref:Uncharacterized protein n=1 Tax=Legionella israelensis TaxID=454 RepID=A0AAX1EF65_9GAMM|nr:exopolysaccharide biosynthesis protein [Legionella israelensis]QBR83755.1 hypothetical protein E3983_04930 [Legionella israelensis]